MQVRNTVRSEALITRGDERTVLKIEIGSSLSRCSETVGTFVLIDPAQLIMGASYGGRNQDQENHLRRQHRRRRR